MWDRWLRRAIFIAAALPVLEGWEVLRAEQPAGASGSPRSREVVFDLREESVFASAADSNQSDPISGARATCSEQPPAAVKAYPKLRSTKPIYGLLRLAPNPQQKESGTPLYFVIDESGEAPAAAPKKEEPTARPSLLEKLSTAILGRSPSEPADASPNLKNTYDLLYADLNGDLDLTNDPVVAPMKAPPPGAVRGYLSLRQAVVFEEISVPLNFGPELGNRPVRLVPRLEIQEYDGQEYRGVEFVSAVVRRGDVKIGSRPYRAVLAQQYVITGRYDGPYTELRLSAPDDPNRREYWWGADQLNAMRLVDGQYYSTSTTPLGDKLIVKPYEGELGTLRIGAGERKLARLSIQGSLESTTTALALGQPGDDRFGTLDPVTECRLPVGDYIPNYVTVEYGHLRLNISQNYHADGKPREIDRNAWIYGIKIRKEEPFVWDFTNPPAVMFASPARDQTFKRGDEIKVMAVLIDPQLTIMIRGLVDTERKQRKTVETGDGKTSSYETEASLDPMVTITNAAGKTVAEGPMPFG